MSDIVIKAENLGKKYTIGHQASNGRYLALRDVVMQNARSLWRTTTDLLRGQPIIQGDDLEEVWALKDLNFEIRRGEAVGIIGRNGAGKSTLLKILSRITEPSAGRVTIKGRVSSLLEVGTGFHPELTGRENIYLNGAILGMTRTEIKRKFDEIVDFSGVEKFLDTPVKRFSSGMYVRLAFAVAAHLEPEILLVDEVLAVGDAEFQKKCLGKMGNVAQEGRTVLFVSHNMAAIQNLCERAILLISGHICKDGSATSAIDKYLTPTNDNALSRDFTATSVERGGTGDVRFQSVDVISSSGQSVSSIVMGDGIRVRMEALAYSSTSAVEFGIGLYNLHGLRICGLNSNDLSAFTIKPRPGQRVFVECAIPKMNISQGVYYLNIMMRSQGRSIVDYIERAVSFEVLPTNYYGTGHLPAGDNLIFLNASWKGTTSMTTSDSSRS